MSRFTAFPGKYGFLLPVVFALLFVIVSVSLVTVATSASNTNQAFGVLTGNEQFTFVVNKIASSPGEDADIKNSPVFADFDNWVKQYGSQNFSNAIQNDELGKELAIKRRQILKELIQKDPRAALEKAISPETRGSLPSFVAEYAEKRISASGDFLAFETDETDATSKQMNGSHLEYKVVVGKSVYKAFVYGRLLTATSKLNIPLQGIILDDAMAVDEQPLRKLDPSEYESRQVDSAKVDENSVVAEIGGELRYFSKQADFDNFVRQQIEWESKIGPARAKGNLSPQEPTSLWTEGAKTVLVIRVDFPDKTGDPIDYYNQPFTSDAAQNLFNSQISPFYVNNSYGKTSLAPTVTSVVRLPQPQTFYTQGGNYYNLLTDARDAARSAGFDTNNFDLDVVAFSYTSGFGWAGISGVGYKGSLINGAFSLPVIAHELGHQFGLLHANLWRTTDGTIIGQGSNAEAADCFDTMSYCIAGMGSHFNARYKNILDWITDANVQTVTASGVYRVFAQDSATPGGIRTLKIKKDDTKNYWVEFRQLFTDNSNAMNGAILHWDFSSQNFQETQLLDMNPTTSTVSDAPLLIGQSFYDSASQIKITVVGKGGTTPESLDVRVELNSGTTPTPTPTPNCTYSITPASQNFSTAGGTGSVNVTTPSGCSWTAAANQNFISVTAGSAGSGNGTVNYLVAANTGAARSGTITVAGQTFTVQQSGVTIGSYTLVVSPAVAAPGGQLTVNFTAPSGSSTLDWIGLYKVGAANTDYLDGGYTNGLTAGVLNGNAPSQTGQYEFRYLLNNTYTSVATSNTITVQTTTPTPTPTPTITPTPTPAPTCNYSITSSSQSFSAAGGTGTIKVTTTGGCNWTVTGNSSWITIVSGNSGSGTGAISFTVQPNTTSARTGTITVAGQIYTVTQAAGGVSNIRTAFDYDGDGRADIGVFRPSNGTWYLLNSSSGFSALQFGISSDKLVPADYDGDGKADIAVYRNGVWYLQRSRDGFTGIAFGAPDDIPVAADFDGDGRADIGVFRPSNGTWYIYNLATNQYRAYQFGQAGDIPVVGDYDGDGKADIAVYRPSSGTWYIQQSSLGFTGIAFGAPDDIPVAADFDGDGRTDVAVFRPSNGTWYLNKSSEGFSGYQFGQVGDKPVPADYDGDGRADIAVYRNGVWYLQRSRDGFTGIAFGATNDAPVPNAFIP